MGISPGYVEQSANSSVDILRSVILTADSSLNNADIWVGYDGAGACTFTLRGSVSLHFEDITQVITDLPEFINKGILSESYSFFEYMKTKDLRKFGAHQQFTPYLATGVSNGTFTRVALSTLWQSFTIGALLKHFPAKKPMFVVIAYEGHIHTSEEEDILLARMGKQIPKQSGIKEVMRKRSRSMAMKKVQVLNESSSPDPVHTPSPVGKRLRSRKSIPALETDTTELALLMSPERRVSVKHGKGKNMQATMKKEHLEELDGSEHRQGKRKEVDNIKDKKLPKGYVYEPVPTDDDNYKVETMDDDDNVE
ncbi:hypothetical protein BDD12DRAFT_883721 [Trichophaea hybrida]|nr:hypothetical protein BDD12DRAFT_883721 [Trichophaea hybrida]